jgi:hypothetical protein
MSLTALKKQHVWLGISDLLKGCEYEGKSLESLERVSRILLARTLLSTLYYSLLTQKNKKL